MLLEKCVAFQLIQYLDSHTFMPSFQSGLRKLSILLKTSCSCFWLFFPSNWPWPCHRVTIYSRCKIKLITSVVFCTIDHVLPLNRLLFCYHLEGRSMVPFFSYWWVHTCIRGLWLKPHSLQCRSLSRKAVISPLLFVLFTALTKGIF